MRRAANFAVDRQALADAQQTVFLAVPADRYLPPGSPVYTSAHVYPLEGPDLARASTSVHGALSASRSLIAWRLPRRA
jgi:hypothetical protein